MPKKLPDPSVRIAALRDSPHEGLKIASAKDSKTAEIYLYDVIGAGFFFGVSAGDFVKELRDLDDDVEEIRVHINSPGGDSFDGIAIMNALRAHEARIVCIVDGLAASAASYIAMAGDEVVMMGNAEMMIHDAWGFCIGNAKDMHDFGNVLDKLSDNIASIYADRTDTEVKQWRDLMLDETWYTADEAVDVGLADRVDKGSRKDDGGAKDKFDLSIFTYAGRSKAPAPPALKPPAASAAGSKKSHGRSSAVAFTDEQITDMRQKLGIAEDADEATILAALDEALEERADDPASSGGGQTSIPDGHVVIPEARLNDLEASARVGVEAAERIRVRERDEFLNSNRTKYAPANREAWAKEYDRDPEGTRKYFDSAPDIIPVDQLGHDGDPSATTKAAEDADYDAVYPDEKKAS